MKPLNYAPVALRCVFWEDFRRVSKDAEMIIYEIKVSHGLFRIYAVKENVFIYEESLPFPEKVEILRERSLFKARIFKSSFNSNRFVISSGRDIAKKLRCGLLYSVKPRLVRETNRWIAEFEYKFESAAVSEFLSQALETKKDRIIEGSLLKIFA